MILKVDLSNPCRTTNATCTNYEYWGWIGNINNKLTIDGKAVYWSDRNFGGGKISREDAEKIEEHLIAIREIMRKRGVGNV